MVVKKVKAINLNTRVENMVLENLLNSIEHSILILVFSERVDPKNGETVTENLEMKNRKGIFNLSVFLM